MKRIFSWVLALSLVCSMFLISPAGCAEGGNETASFDAIVTNSFGRQESEWMESNITRATLYYSLMLDLKAFTDENPIPDDLSEFPYVGRNETTLFVYIRNKENDFMVLYYPLIERAYYYTMDKASGLALNMLLPEMCKDGYSPVSVNDISAAIEIVENHVKSHVDDIKDALNKRSPK